MKLFDIAESVINVPGILAWLKTRNMGVGGGVQPPSTKQDSGAKSSALGFGQTDEAIALHAVVTALTEKKLVTPKQRAAFVRIITTRLTLPECTVLERTLGLDEQKRTFTEIEHGADAKGKPKKTEKTHEKIMNFRGLETVVGICKLAETDEESALLLLKKLGATRTTGDVWKDQLREIREFLQTHGVDLENTIGALRKFFTGTEQQRNALKEEQLKTKKFLHWVTIIAGAAFVILLVITVANRT